jgi:hypothetical protein
MNNRLAISLLLTGLVAGSSNGVQQMSSSMLPASVDHLVYGTPDLKVGVQEVEKALGIRATPGGQHPGAGTRNALIALGPSMYLEIIGPDPEQPPPPRPRSFGIDDLTAPRMVTWAAKGSDLDRLAGDALRQGLRLGDVGSGSRQTPDGRVLSWRYTNPRTMLADGTVPFFIDWGQSPHPAATAAPGATLVALQAVHPDPEGVRGMLEKLGLELAIAQGDRSALIATIDCPRGRVTLR